MTVKEFAGKHGFGTLCMPDPDKEIRGCYIGDLLSWVMGRAEPGNVWLTIMSNVNVVAVASLSDAGTVLFTEGVKPDAGIVETALAKGVNLLTTDMRTFEAALDIAADV